MKRQRIIGAVVVALVIAAGLWWFVQPGAAPVKVRVTPAAKLVTIPEGQYPIDPKSPSLHPPPTAPMVLPPAQPHAPQPPGLGTPPSAPTSDPQADLKTALPDIAQLIRTGDGIKEMQTYIQGGVDPQMVQQMQTQLAKYSQMPGWQQSQELTAQAFESLLYQTPTLNAAGDEAMYTVKWPDDNTSSSLVFVKINDKWYIKQGD